MTDPKKCWFAQGKKVSEYLQKNLQRYLLGRFTISIIKHNRCHYSICRKRFEKGISAEIYYLYASVQLLMYFFPISSHNFFAAWLHISFVSNKHSCFSVFYLEDQIFYSNRLLSFFTHFPSLKRKVHPNRYAIEDSSFCNMWSL